MLLKDYTIKIPEGARLQKKDNQTYVYYKGEYRYNKDKRQSTEKRVCVGKSLGNGYMIPNENFSKYFEGLELNLLPPSDKSDTLKIGSIVLFKKLMKDLSLDEVVNIHGREDRVNLIKDLVFYLLIDNRSAFQYFDDFAYDHNIVGRDYSDSYISEFLNGFTNDEIDGFLEAWNKLYSNNEKVYINYDSTNMNTSAKGINLAEYGHSKKESDNPQVNVSFVSLEKDATPLIYELYPGSIVDNTKLKDLADRVRHYGYKNIGFILDRGYYSKSNIDYLDKNNYSFIMMVKGKSAYINALGDKKKDIFNNDIKHFIEDHNVFGGTLHAKMFEKDNTKRYVHLYYDELKAAQEKIIISSKIKELQKEVESIINGDDVSRKHISKLTRFKNYFSFTYIDEYATSYKLQSSKVNKELLDAGYFCLISKDELSAKDALDIYRGRDSIEKLFEALKSSLDFDSLRVHNDNRLKARIHISFIAMIIQSELLKKSRNLKLKEKDRKSYTVPSIIKELEKIECTKYKDEYSRKYRLTSKQKKILEACGVSDKDIDNEVKLINKKLKSANTITVNNNQ